MKVEIDIPDDTCKALKKRAVHEGRTLSNLVIRLLDHSVFGEVGRNYKPKELTAGEMALLRVKRSATRDIVTAKVRNGIFERDQGLCAYCGGLILYDELWHIDHVIPVAKGGSNDPKNLVLSCPACNLKKGAK